MSNQINMLTISEQEAVKSKFGNNVNNQEYLTLDKQALLDKIKSQTGHDFSRNRGIRSYLAMVNQDKRAGACIRALYKAFLPHTDDVSAMAAALICSNRYLNGAQISGFGNYWEFDYTQGKRFPRPGATRIFNYLVPEDQLAAIVSNPNQAVKTFKAIKPETLEKYRQIVILVSRKEQPPQ